MNTLKLNSGDTYEHLCNVTLTKDKFPIAFENKVQELIEECGLSREEAEKETEKMEINLEIYYQKGCGLFAIDEEAAECSSIYSPYTAEEYKL